MDFLKLGLPQGKLAGKKSLQSPCLLCGCYHWWHPHCCYYHAAVAMPLHYLGMTDVGLREVKSLFPGGSFPSSLAQGRGFIFLHFFGPRLLHNFKIQAPLQSMPGNMGGKKKQERTSVSVVIISCFFILLSSWLTILHFSEPLNDCFIYSVQDFQL